MKNAFTDQRGTVVEYMIILLICSAATITSIVFAIKFFLDHRWIAGVASLGGMFVIPFAVWLITSLLHLASGTLQSRNEAKKKQPKKRKMKK